MALPPVASPREIARSAEQEALHLVGDLLREVLEIAVQVRRLVVERGVLRRHVAHSTDRLPSKARPRVTSSAYSRSPPTGSPLARRVTRKPIGRSNRVR